MPPGGRLRPLFGGGASYAARAVMTGLCLPASVPQMSPRSNPSPPSGAEPLLRPPAWRCEAALDLSMRKRIYCY